jgi:hypothetical protein
MIIDSATYDVAMLYFMYYFGFSGRKVTLRMLFSNCLTGFAKIGFQEYVCSLARLEGYLWFFPGVYSMCVPYFDVNDFYFSGHMGQAGTFLYEFTCGYNNHPDSWFRFLQVSFVLMLFTKSLMMIVFRTHYLIDLMAGFMIVLPILHISDKLSWIPDVKITGLSKSERKRQILLYQICSHCGWANPRAASLIDQEELKIQKSK